MAEPRPGSHTPQVPCTGRLPGRVERSHKHRGCPSPAGAHTTIVGAAILRPSRFPAQRLVQPPLPKQPRHSSRSKEPELGPEVATVRQKERSWLSREAEARFTKAVYLNSELTVEAAPSPTQGSMQALFHGAVASCFCMATVYTGCSMASSSKWAMNTMPKPA
ncbi:hypothetical protein GH733_019576 [Mirounga leonina]|nr:hypothetical protein GH733_019576 [Mirounga leonina]